MYGAEWRQLAGGTGVLRAGQLPVVNEEPHYAHDEDSEWNKTIRNRERARIRSILASSKLLTGQSRRWIAAAT
jgi:hypothetical protein